ncbi:MAG: hypothetical protein WBE26_01800, partial [Phycisphaerae bacterium]
GGWSDVTLADVEALHSYLPAWPDDPRRSLPGPLYDALTNGRERPIRYLNGNGQTLTAGQVEEFVLVNTPACNYKRALRTLEQAGRLEPVDPPTDRRRGAFNDKNLRVRFVHKIPHSDLTLFDQ